MALRKNEAVQTAKRFAALVRSEIDNEALIFLFGSCAKNNANDRSDIDLCTKQYAQQWASIIETWCADIKQIVLKERALLPNNTPAI